MSLENIYYIGQTIAVIALVGSLVFVGLQMREQNKQSRLEAVRQLGELFDAWWEISVSQDKNADMFAKVAYDGFESVDELLRARFAATMQRILRRWEIVYFYYTEGRLNPELWRSNEKALAPMTLWKGFREYWAIRRDWYSAEFADYIDSVMSKTNPEDAFIGGGGERMKAVSQGLGVAINEAGEEGAQ